MQNATVIVPNIRRSFGPAISAREITVAAGAAFMVWIVLAICQFRSAPDLGGDFDQFYAAGAVLNQHGDLYDVALQKQVCDRLHSGHSGPNHGPAYAYSPTLALLFRPLALLPFKVAYAVWACVSLLLYGCGLWALSPFLKRLPVDGQRAFYALALSFSAFLYFTIIAGQISAIAFFLVACAIRADLDGKYLLSGALLAACAYKPTLIVILAPCLLIRRNWRMLAGAAVSALGAIALTASVLGIQPYLQWARVLTAYTRFAGGIDDKQLLPAWTAALHQSEIEQVQMQPHFVDLSHFFQRILGVGSPAARVAFAAIAIPAVLYLLSKWRKFDSAGPEQKRMYWALALTATLLINAYAMVYDSILVVAAFLLIYGIRSRAFSLAQIRALNIVGVLLYISPIFIAAGTYWIQVQPVTVLLVLLGLWLPWAIQKEGRWRRRRGQVS
jgi:hypothetical protein